MIRGLLAGKGVRPRSLAFWSWNGALEPSLLKEQIAFLERKGFGGFIIHARSGLTAEYLGQEWMDAVALSIDEAKARGMQVWLYDDFGFPSGFAGGKLLRREEYHDRYLTCRENDGFDAGALANYRREGNRLRRVTENEGTYRYIAVYEHISPSTADILDPAVTEAFLQETHERYYARFGAEFGKTVKGFFTDEPQYFRAGQPYTKMLAPFFRREYGMNFADGAALLFYECEGYETFRYRYWQALQTLFLDNYAKKVYDWCCAHGAMLTGHAFEEMSPSAQLLGCAGVMPFYLYEHMPGIDWLGRRAGDGISSRQVASVAAQTGRRDILTESFAGCGWDATPAELKQIADFQFADGVNVLCDHLVPLSMRGQRKYDYPAFFHPVSPWVRAHFERFNRYFDRLGALLAGSEERVCTAVFHPVKSCYLFCKRGAASAEPEEIDASLRRVSAQLHQRGVAFHFLDEEVAARLHAHAEGGVLCVGACRYTHLIFPRTNSVTKHSARLLADFLAGGGKVLFYEGVPDRLEGEPHDFAALHSNVSMDEIAAQVQYTFGGTHELHTTVRTAGAQTFIYAYNASAQAAHVHLMENGRPVGVREVDPDTLHERTLRELTFEPGQARLLLPEKGAGRAREEPPVEEVTLGGRFSVVESGDNFLPLDRAAYSADGEHFSQEMPLPALFSQLLEERYRGQIWLRYTCSVQVLPPSVRLCYEGADIVRAWCNGRLLAPQLCANVPAAEHLMWADVAPFLRIGRNEIVLQGCFSQSERVYSVLFGAATESARNCLTLGTEIESVWLAGAFGVRAAQYVREGALCRADGFTLTALPAETGELTEGGFPFYCGEIALCRQLTLPHGRIRLRVPGRFSAAQVRVNGQETGTLFFGRTADLSPWARAGINEIELRLFISPRNLLGPHHTKACELDMVRPRNFTFEGGFRGGVCADYEPSYALVRQGIFTKESI